MVKYQIVTGLTSLYYSDTLLSSFTYSGRLFSSTACLGCSVIRRTVPGACMRRILNHRKCYHGNKNSMYYEAFKTTQGNELSKGCRSMDLVEATT